MVNLPLRLRDGMLVVGPSNVGKTHLTARALDAWISAHGSTGVVVLEFAPEVERDGVLLGGRLSRFTTVPDTVWTGVIAAHAPRTEGETDAEASALAERNADHALRLLDAAPSNPTAVFVNDATVALQADASRTAPLTSYCDRADVAVLNAFESDELGVDDPVSRNERTALDRLRSWADTVVELHSPR